MSEDETERNRLVHQALSGQIISAFYEVYNTMVRGLVEGCYQNALYVELQERGIPVDREVPFGVRYKERIVKATDTELGLLMYFGSKPLFRRFVHTQCA